jgi:hypothetical protein
VAPLLEKELAKKPSLEVRRRLERIIDKFSERWLARNGPALIRQLGDNAFEQREKATRQLIEAGKPALPLLRKALDNTDPEIRNRARVIIDAINKKG